MIRVRAAPARGVAHCSLQRLDILYGWLERWKCINQPRRSAEFGRGRSRRVQDHEPRTSLHDDVLSCRHSSVADDVTKATDADIGQRCRGSAKLAKMRDASDRTCLVPSSVVSDFDGPSAAPQCVAVHAQQPCHRSKAWCTVKM